MNEPQIDAQATLSAQVAILDNDGVVTAGSAAWRDFLTDGPSAEAVAEGIHAVLASEIPLFLLEYSAPGPDERWFNLRVTRFPGEGQVQAVAITEEVTARKNAEESLRRRNAELDQFAYVTSHDLKAPLRGIANLSRWIEEDLEGSITPEVAGQFDLLRGRVNRMEAMIEAILQYSRIDHTETPLSETVDVRVLLTEVIDLLSPPTRIAISMDDAMPTLHTPRLRLFQVFQNLLSNAIKHHDKPSGTIHVGARVEGEWVEFSVRDDGPGIAPKFQERIWVIFQTLEARDKVESTGVGLALVKKIVEGQGGTVSVESEAGQGATFKFTWPDG